MNVQGQLMTKLCTYVQTVIVTAQAAAGGDGLGASIMIITLTVDVWCVLPVFSFVSQAFIKPEPTAMDARLVCKCILTHSGATFDALFGLILNRMPSLHLEELSSGDGG
jgi:hypothetical protein